MFDHGFLFCVSIFIMNYRNLGTTGLKVSEIGFGSWAIGGTGYGDTDDMESKKALNRALDMGVNFIDTADSYGNGHSESLIGGVMDSRGDKNTLICTKFGWDFYSETGIKSNLEKKYVEFALHNSLQRLKREFIDIYLIHDSNPQNIYESGVIDTVKELKKTGLIRFFGVSVSDYYMDAIMQSVDEISPDVIEVRFNLLDNKSKIEILDQCCKKGIGIIIKEPLANGLLSGKYNNDSKFAKNDHRNGFSKEFLEQQITGVNLLKQYFGSNTDLVRGSIKYTLYQPCVSVVIPGAKTVSQVEQNISSLEYEFNVCEFEKFKKENLI